MYLAVDMDYKLDLIIIVAIPFLTLANFQLTSKNLWLFICFLLLHLLIELIPLPPSTSSSVMTRLLLKCVFIVNKYS